MIISKFTYDCMLELISVQQKTIEELQSQNNELKSVLNRCKADLIDLQRFCMNYAVDNPDFIDFPNTTQKGGNSANTGTDDINDIFNL